MFQFGLNSWACRYRPPPRSWLSESTASCTVSAWGPSLWCLDLWGTFTIQTIAKIATCMPTMPQQALLLGQFCWPQFGPFDPDWARTAGVHFQCAFIHGWWHSPTNDAYTYGTNKVMVSNQRAMQGVFKNSPKLHWIIQRRLEFGFSVKCFSFPSSLFPDSLPPFFLFTLIISSFPTLSTTLFLCVNNLRDTFDHFYKRWTNMVLECDFMTTLPRTWPVSEMQF